ncbi:glycosyltransferase [Nitrosospira sp. Is2]|uniref:glycosyltransferase n=1 Tax=Nitrosospira sp. Is2 TaxID=3080532 RepID=UPI002955B8B1|nr:glycosyltransferase [Nitrosospira sp. Is2]WON74100.1 glycosyltransferase [Nitrosospira sp. Is2]
MTDRNSPLAECDPAVIERDAALAHLDFLKNTRSWRITSPLRFLMRLMRWGLTSEDRSRIIGWWKDRNRKQRIAANVKSKPNAPVKGGWVRSFADLPALRPLRGRKPAAAVNNKFDVICFANIEWSARFQRPQQMMRQFAEHGYRVFYVVPSRVSSGRQAYSVNQVLPGIFEVALSRHAVQDFYTEGMSDENVDACLLSLEKMSEAFRIKTAISVIHLSYWTPLVLRLRMDLGWRIQYDCMDDWVDFPHIGTALLRQEEVLVAEADLITVTASVLNKKWSAHNPICSLIRNGVDFSFFTRHCVPNNLLPEINRPIIGFYGALAEWVDYQLLADVAMRRRDWNFVLVGDIFVSDLAGLESMPNVHLIGRKPYAEMPHYLYRFDVCLIPFRVYNVTHAVDPVKFYEFMSAGKPVVSVPLEEMKVYEEFVYFANSPEEFIEKIELGLDERALELVTSRVELARANDWKNRFDDTLRAITDVYPGVSIIIVTYNNLELTQRCVESVFRNTTYPNYEVIIIDNASVDDTRNYLRYLARSKPAVKVVLNDENSGFAAANNQGLRMAQGDYLVLLNNDTVVPKGWVEPMLRHLDLPHVGLVGPVTNSVGNEAKIEVEYSSLDQMEDFSDRYTAQHRGHVFDISMLAMFCIAMRREVFEKIGFLDEKFGVGMFEDDDYSRRAHNLGYRTVCAEDAFVHHYGQASFKKLIASGKYQELWDRNQAYFESKWGAWKPHLQRGSH